MNINSVLKKASEKAGMVRSTFNENNLPTSFDEICVLLFLGDIRSTMIMSSLLLKRYREESKGTKYFILCSWSGNDKLFPYVDEYWSVPWQDKLNSGIKDFENKSEVFLSKIRHLNMFFSDVIEPSIFKEVYNQGIQEGFFDRYKHVRYFSPSVPSLNIMGAGFNRDIISKPGHKVFICPSKKIYHHKGIEVSEVLVSENFWKGFVDNLLKAGLIPVLYKNNNSYDLSSHFLDKCVYVKDVGIDSVLSVMRMCSVVVDVFNQMSRLAILAKTPHFVFDERSRFSLTKEYEIDDLCAKDIPKKYIFSFPTIIESGFPADWQGNFYDVIGTQLMDFLSQIDYDKLPVTTTSEVIVPYSSVRTLKNKRLGTKFIRIEKDLF